MKWRLFLLEKESKGCLLQKKEVLFDTCQLDYLER